MKQLRFSCKAVRLLGLSAVLAVTAQSGLASEVTVIGVRRGSDGSAGLLLKVPDNVELSAQDLGAMVDAANRPGAGASNRQVTHAVSGRRFGDVAVVGPPEVRRVKPNKTRESSMIARSTRSEAKPKAKVTVSPVPVPAVKPTKPDVIIFEPEEKSAAPGGGATTPPPAPAVPGQTPAVPASGATPGPGEKTPGEKTPGEKTPGENR